MVRLLPRETKFLDLFAEIANNLVDGARTLTDLLENYDYEKLPSAVAHITKIEHRGDEMTHRILIKLNQTFITPFDREDIHLLASSLDDVLDFIFAAADRLLNYKITQPSPSAKILARIILKQAEELAMLPPYSEGWRDIDWFKTRVPDQTHKRSHFIQSVNRPVPSTLLERTAHSTRFSCQWVGRRPMRTHNPAPRDWLCKGDPVTARMLRCGSAYPAFAILGRSSS